MPKPAIDPTLRAARRALKESVDSAKGILERARTALIRYHMKKEGTHINPRDFAWVYGAVEPLEAKIEAAGLRHSSAAADLALFDEMHNMEAQ